MNIKTKTNIETPQTMGSTLNKRSTTTEPPGDLKAFYWRQIFALDSVVIKTQSFF